MKDMLGRGGAVSVKEAFERLFDKCPETLPKRNEILLDHSYGRILAQDIISPEDLPLHPRSTMDGYAVIASDTFGSTERTPAYLKIICDIPMGYDSSCIITQGTAARISTGGFLPSGADAVLMLEHTQVMDDSMFESLKSVAPGENVVIRGEDIEKGEIVFNRGRRLKPQDVSMLAALGISKVSVYSAPKVSLISTGDELIPYNRVIEKGKIRDSNHHLLFGLVKNEGAEPVSLGIVGDDYNSLNEMLHKAVSTSDLILITGGSSVGARDMTEKVLSELGEIIFHSVTMKPGKPLMACVVGEKLAFGLPGHPRAVAVCFDIFVRPLLRKISGYVDNGIPAISHTVKAKIEKSIHSAPGRQDNICVSLVFKDDELHAIPVMGKSGLISTMIKSDGTVMIPDDSLGIEKGDFVDVRLY